MKFFTFLIFCVALLLLGSSDVSGQKMNDKELGKILTKEADSISGEGGYWQGRSREDQETARRRWREGRVKIRRRGGWLSWRARICVPLSPVGNPSPGCGFVRLLRIAPHCKGLPNDSFLHSPKTLPQIFWSPGRSCTDAQSYWGATDLLRTVSPGK